MKKTVIWGKTTDLRLNTASWERPKNAINAFLQHKLYGLYSVLALILMSCATQKAEIPKNAWHEKERKNDITCYLTNSLSWSHLHRHNNHYQPPFPPPIAKYLTEQTQPVPEHMCLTGLASTHACTHQLRPQHQLCNYTCVTDSSPIWHNRCRERETAREMEKDR